MTVGVIEMIMLLVGSIASQLTKARASLVTYALGTELNISCYKFMAMDVTRDVIKEVKVCE